MQEAKAAGLIDDLAADAEEMMAKSASLDCRPSPGQTAVGPGGLQNARRRSETAVYRPNAGHRSRHPKNKPTATSPAAEAIMAAAIESQWSKAVD
ncbi:MAG: hypothetical protein IPK53_08995 [bacterium]|nr:hypothetical protein [bacterium]